MLFMLPLFNVESFSPCKGNITSRFRNDTFMGNLNMWFGNLVCYRNETENPEESVENIYLYLTLSQSHSLSDTHTHTHTIASLKQWRKSYN